MAFRFRAIDCIASAATLAVALGCVTVTPALAADDGQGDFFSSVLQMIGVDIGVASDAGPPINYHERPPLVLPPNMTLPKPRPPITARAKGWPQDPDILKAKEKAAERAKAPRVDSETYDPAKAAEESRRRGTPDPRADAKSRIPTGDCLDKQTCTPQAFWSMLRNTKLNDDKKAELVPGQEPPREYLTQPPPGYMMPTKVVKETMARPRESQEERDVNTDNPARYFRRQQDRQSSPDSQ